ncbi:hypothetical protein SAMN05660772_02829 [Pasteurella testudinis DSM 23072]|uniref:Uncharacterized protein n=1 Tax=Pasteurella testudinis DSM 23072 TaxID=1122938 RepID=A0A1W1V5B4_9PAST|nr:hypothetical protein [Pasteurella testudinis]SMB88552.1 hypothetical protein SAMN05660772_02829 [Pasteurella testudinis DSM 23072]SUB51600.1 Uncharacterised protein [Pasteurella testudinis]
MTVHELLSGFIQPGKWDGFEKLHIKTSGVVALEGFDRDKKTVTLLLSNNHAKIHAKLSLNELDELRDFLTTFMELLTDK